MKRNGNDGDDDVKFVEQFFSRHLETQKTSIFGISEVLIVIKSRPPFFSNLAFSLVAVATSEIILAALKCVKNFVNVKCVKFCGKLLKIVFH
jgi:hypothetical protein